MSPDEKLDPLSANQTRDRHDLYERVVALIRDEMRFRGPIQPTTSLQQIGFDGDDALLFMSRFAEDFRVDMTDFEIRRHFGPEGLWLPSLWAKTVPITISDLVAAASAGVWPAG
jgi:hypothetical protein